MTGLAEKDAVVVIEGEFEVVKAEVEVTGRANMDDALVVIDDVVVTEEVDKVEVIVATVEDMMKFFVPRSEIFLCVRG